MRGRALGPALCAAITLALAGCGDKAEPAAATTVASDDAPALNAQAHEAALDLIRQDLNAPIPLMQSLLSTADSDGTIDLHELAMQTPDGRVPIAGWAWSRGLLTVANDAEYGPYLTLSEKGRHFVQADATGWFQIKPDGMPRMQCSAGVSVTSANCDAEVNYLITASRETGLPPNAVPRSSAYLEAAFTPGAGWSVTRLSADGDVPSAIVRKALLGSADDQQARQDVFVQAIQARAQAMNAASVQARAADQAVSAVDEDDYAPAARKPVAEATRAPIAIVNPSYARRPSQDELMSVYPQQALARGLAGRSSMTCTATVAGLLEDCVSDAETPPGSRFGQAGVAAARFFRMRPRTQDGQAVDSPVSVSIVWQP